MCTLLMISETTTWMNAVQKCRSIGLEWKLPTFEEDSDIASKMSEANLKMKFSVWTGMKREIFDGYFWEDGSFDGM